MPVAELLKNKTKDRVICNKYRGANLLLGYKLIILNDCETNVCMETENISFGHLACAEISKYLSTLLHFNARSESPLVVLALQCKCAWS
jgi:hypothetical protein